MESCTTCGDRYPERDTCPKCGWFPPAASGYINATYRLKEMASVVDDYVEREVVSEHLLLCGHTSNDMALEDVPCKDESEWDESEWNAFYARHVHPMMIKEMQRGLDMLIEVAKKAKEHLARGEQS
jgi:hypothetical protein